MLLECPLIPPFNIPQQRTVPRACDRHDGQGEARAERLPCAASRRAALRARAAQEVRQLRRAAVGAQPGAHGGVLRAGRGRSKHDALGFEAQGLAHIVSWTGSLV